jgi:DNA repair protein RecN (Recombination protein N)
MLTHLQIRDFAIIDLIELEVRAGLTVLTGETGAGKSIIVDALALLAGGKGGAEVPNRCARSSLNNPLKRPKNSRSAASSPTTDVRAAISMACRCRYLCCAT